MEAILIVLPQSDKLDALMGALRSAGIPGATVFESQGLEFIGWLNHPAMMRYFSLEGTDRETGKTLLTVVPDELRCAVMEAVEKVLDGFSSPNSGILCSWSVGTFRCYQGDKPQLQAAGGRS